MKNVRHIVARDLRRLWPWLAVWFAVQVAQWLYVSRWIAVNNSVLVLVAMFNWFWAYLLTHFHFDEDAPIGVLPGWRTKPIAGHEQVLARWFSLFLVGLGGPVLVSSVFWLIWGIGFKQSVEALGVTLLIYGSALLVSIPSAQLMSWGRVRGLRVLVPIVPLMLLGLQVYWVREFIQADKPFGLYLGGLVVGLLVAGLGFSYLLHVRATWKRWLAVQSGLLAVGFLSGVFLLQQYNPWKMPVRSTPVLPSLAESADEGTLPRLHLYRFEERKTSYAWSGRYFAGLENGESAQTFRLSVNFDSAPSEQDASTMVHIRDAWDFDVGLDALLSSAKITTSTASPLLAFFPNSEGHQARPSVGDRFSGTLKIRCGSLRLLGRRAISVLSDEATSSLAGFNLRIEKTEPRYWNGSGIVQRIYATRPQGSSDECLVLWRQDLSRCASSQEVYWIRWQKTLVFGASWQRWEAQIFGKRRRSSESEEPWWKSLELVSYRRELGGEKRIQFSTTIESLREDEVTRGRIRADRW